MSVTTPSAQQVLPRVRTAVSTGANMACLVGAQALMVAGQGIAAWALTLAGGLAFAIVMLGRQVRDVPRHTTFLDGVVGFLGLIVLLVVGALVARTVVLDHAWLAVVAALATGAATGGFLRRQQLRIASRRS
jgi:hypothetical protein